MSANRFQSELDDLLGLVAAARKSFNEYKPILTWVQNGQKRTEVLGRAVKVDELGNFHQTFARGVIFTDRQEAIRYAEVTKQVRIDDCLARAKKHGFEIAAERGISTLFVQP